jgi:hypothetical protein
MIIMKRGNNYYSLEPDKEKNRIYFSIMGQAPSTSAIPSFEQDWKDVVGEVQSGFTILGDLMEMKPHVKDVEDLNVKVQGWLMQNGCKKVAQLAPLEAMANVNEFSEKSGLKEILRAFNSKKVAEMWLDR